MLLHGGITFFLLSYLVAVKKSRGSIACGAMILPQSQYESLVLLIAAFLELVKILQCEQYFGRYYNMKYVYLVQVAAFFSRV